MTVTKDYADESGVMHRVLLPHDDANREEGIPLSLDLRILYPDAPIGFVARLSEALFTRGLVEPHDYMRPGGHELARDAVLSTVKEDALSIISLAKSMLDSQR